MCDSLLERCSWVPGRESYASIALHLKSNDALDIGSGQRGVRIRPNHGEPFAA
jgi:hypothetical protein